MSDSAKKSPSIVIFSDEPGWHGRQLKESLATHGERATFISLIDCSLVMTNDCAEVRLPGVALENIKGAFVRGVPGGSLEQVISRLNILHMLEGLRVPVFNSGRAIERTVDKAMTSFLLAQHGLPCARTWVTESREYASQIAAQCIEGSGSVVMKPLFGSQGNGVERVDNLADFARLEPTNGVYYLQEYLRPDGATYKDWRVFVIGGRAVAAMQRTSHHWVTNRAQGATCEAMRPNPALSDLAERAAMVLDVDYAGIDLMRDATGAWCVSEVNGIPAWQGLQRVSTVEISEILIDAFLRKIADRKSLAAAG